jgi:hypothetical protein
MNSTEKALARLLFKARVASLTGMAFQNFFSEIMKYARPDFMPVKPQGSEGDWKNDGHEPKRGRYYQVYSPEVFDEAAALKKLSDDFEGLIAKWGDSNVYPEGISEFFFVINDAYRVTPGAFPTTIAALESLRQKHGLKECKPMLAKDLEDILLSLSDDQINAVVGFLPNPAEIRTLDYSVVNEVIRFIVDGTHARSLSQTLVDPDFDKKIEFNDLGVTAVWLRDAAYRVGTLENYFRSNSTFARQTVRNKLNQIYKDAKEKQGITAENGTTIGDFRFVTILEEITPRGDDKRRAKELQDAALVVMAYFFESCDIFEEPPDANAR